MPPESDPLNDSSPRPDEKRILGLILALALIAVLGSWLAASALAHRDHLKGVPPDRERRLSDFVLTDAAGRTVTRADFNGKILVVSFLFTSCSLTCPEVSRHMAEIQRLTAADDRVRLVSITVDPRSDTPPVLAKWGTRFGADTNRWFLLTGEKPRLHGLIARSFLPQDNSDPFNSMPGHFTGTDRIALVDQRGRVRIFFDGLRNETPAAVLAEIVRLKP